MLKYECVVDVHVRTVAERNVSICSMLKGMTHLLRKSRSLRKPSLGPEGLRKGVEQRWVAMHYERYDKDVADRKQLRMELTTPWRYLTDSIDRNGAGDSKIS
jgi:hypothetical protein